MNKVCIVGSMNMDVVLSVKAMPKEGETIFSDEMKMIPGGKGANQAVAAARSGAEVIMIAKTGEDANGKKLIDELIKDNIESKFIFKDRNNPTGTAIITVDNDANNSIIVVSGSNMTLNKKDIIECEDGIKGSDIVITQFETPMEAGIEAFKIAKDNSKITILNPAPAKEIKDELLKYTDIIVPNETEVFSLTGIEVHDLETAKVAAKELNNKGVKYVIVTLGEKGAALIGDGMAEIIPAFKVEAVDTTAAGDSFIGGFSSKLDIKNINFESVKAAILYGNKVSSIAVQRPGAQPSIPYLEEL
ncbi:ribokinase [Clostridium sediminicola]|uniref:ribokinase n=1 Tax=Clostridium sediminicola TaxID=3114879 RepID=UPI0031F23003